MAVSSFMTVEEVNEQLNKGLEEIFKSDRFQDLLHVMSKVNNYSFNNSLMIAMQKPDATMVQGFNAWKEFGRYVQKGEKGIKILAPNIKKMDMEKVDPKTKQPILDKKGNVQTEEKKVITGFRIVHVYDVSQTDGKEIPSVRDFINREMANDEGIKRLYDDFFNHVKQSYPIREDATDKGVGGYYSPKTNEIVISNTENDTDTLKFRVLIHEYAHAKVHNLESEMKDLPRGHKEAQAESVAYMVSQYYGLDTGDISLGYIATWSQDLSLARQAMEEVQKVANEIILTIDELQRDKIQEFYLDNSKSYDETIEYLKNRFQTDVNNINNSGEQPIQFELLNKENGMVVSAKLDYSEKLDKFQLKTDRNWIIPLTELNKNGEYYILNKELENGNIADSYKRANEILSVSQIKNGNYTVSVESGTESISKEYSNKADAEKQLLRISLSQSLHEQTFLKNQLKNEPNAEVQTRLEGTQLQINFDVSKYLNHNNSEKQIMPTGDGGSKIGWALMKNRNITDINGLEEYAFGSGKGVPGQKALREAITNAYDISSKEAKNEKKADPIEIER
ncbi:hypothetical protein KM915_20865 [Cytobacillus oceanisediminis]|uniref:ArdC family protein n=1 Tax=Cytobacillus oceanisediminis TaxID=665099 RepID=UPI001C231121|nr:ArdC family protein [Cytobacillus oceanisediminis]MBU8732503.1 hypothetical protein [Cytobacillus oceanisediminis]